MSDLLGGDFSSSFHGNNADEIDFDAAASAFPDISLDGTGVEAAASNTAARTNSGFSFDEFEDALPDQPAMKITGDDEIDKFESEFPDIEVPTVSLAFLCAGRRRCIHRHDEVELWS